MKRPKRIMVLTRGPKQGGCIEEALRQTFPLGGFELKLISVPSRIAHFNFFESRGKILVVVPDSGDCRVSVHTIAAIMRRQNPLAIIVGWAAVQPNPDPNTELDGLIKKPRKGKRADLCQNLIKVAREYIEGRSRKAISNWLKSNKEMTWRLTPLNMN